MSAWVVRGVTVAILAPTVVLMQMKQNRLTAYTITLLTRVETYRAQREKFIAHVEALPASSPRELATGASQVIDRLEGKINNLSCFSAGVSLWYTLQELRAARKDRGAA